MKQPLTAQALEISGYQLISNIESNACRRGVGIYVKSSFKVSTLIPSPHFCVWVENVWVRLQCGNSTMVVRVVYCSPNTPSCLESEQYLANIISDIIKDSCNQHVVILGDFNFPDYDWVDGSGFSAKEQESPFLTCLSEHSLFQTVDQPTRYRDGQASNILDVVILNNPDLWTKDEFLAPIGNNDHAAILTELRLSTTQPLPKQHKVIDYRRISERLADFDWDAIFTSDIKESWQKFKAVLLVFEKAHTRTFWTRQAKTLPFMTCLTRKLLNRKNRTWKHFKKKKIDAKYQKYQKAQNEATNSIKQLKKRHEERLAENIKNNPKLFWQYASVKC